MDKRIRVAITGFLISSLKLLLCGPTVAQNSERGVYTTYSNGVTTVAVAESTRFGDSYSGYQTIVQGRYTFGWLRIERIQQDKTYTYLSGIFKDICTGQITIRRPNRGLGLSIVAQVTWIVTRQTYDNDPQANQNCKAPMGQQYQVNLPEAIPKPDNRGEFTNKNSNTFLFDSTVYYTWQQWQVVSADGALNCRDRPLGKVKRSYKTGQVIQKLGLEHREGLNIVELPDGSSWLKTRERCYVRANNQFLKPVSLPIQAW